VCDVIFSVAPPRLPCVRVCVAPPWFPCMRVYVCCVIQQKRYFGLQIMCPSFLTDSNQLYTVSRACEKSVKYKFSGKSVQFEPI
jgi:hypothetical protein